jgi:hypothetical protein
MKNLHTLKLNTLKLNASSGGPAKNHTAPAATETSHEQPAGAASPKRGPSAGAKQRMLALLAIELAATMAAVAATGAVHTTIFRVAIAGVALTVAALVGVETVASHRRARVAAAPAAVPAPAAQAATAAPAKPLKVFNKTRVGLLFVMAIGFAAFFGHGNTFAGFTAETANPNDALASGTLLLKDHVSTDCNSQAGESNNNVNANCDVALAFGSSSPGQEPGVYVGTATVVLTNTGTLNASKLYLWAPWSNAVYSGSTINAGGTVGPLSVYASGHGPAGLEGPMAAGDLITVASGNQSQSFCVGSGGAAAGATSIPIAASCTVSSVTYTNTATITISAGATIQDNNSDTTAANTNCYDTQVTNLGWNPTTNNPLCSSALLYVQETTGGKNYCWFGSGHDSATGMCDAPISVKPTNAGTSIASSTTYNLATALTGNVKAGDQLLFSENGNVVACYANANTYIGALSLATNGTACTVQSGANSGFDNNVVITDKTTLNTLASDYPSSTDSISAFDINRNYGLKKELTPVTANGTTGVAAVDLASSASRTFVVGVFIPGPAASQNQLQALKSTFGLVWHIDQ